MIGINLIVAAVITAGLLGAFLLSNSTVGNLIGNVADLGIQEMKNVSFTLSVDRHGEISFEKQKNLSIEITGRMQGVVGDGEFESGSGASLRGFSGRGRISDMVVLNGTVDKIEISDASLSFKAKKFDASSEFSSASVENLFLAGLRLENVTGSLNQGGTEIKFSSTTVILEGAGGKFTFGNGLVIDGRAKKVSIPTSGIRIE
ncbi:MAG: hypothetical protein HYW27_01510 [Candidatus Aenigmarchaeota archaeon]|nr:hypothetical protein [Candidatus Aenigmarchaeota archaeon]